MNMQIYIALRFFSCSTAYACKAEDNCLVTVAAVTSTSDLTWSLAATVKICRN